MTHQTIYKIRKIVMGIIAVLDGIFLTLIADLFIHKDFVFADGICFIAVGIYMCFVNNTMPTDYGSNSKIKSRVIYQSVSIFILWLIKPAMFPTLWYIYGYGALVAVARSMIITAFVLSLPLDLLHFFINKK